jgi:hypothetical protein
MMIDPDLEICFDMPATGRLQEVLPGFHPPDEAVKSWTRQE